MSEFDVDIRAVSGASYGARASASDINQASNSSLDSAAAQANVQQVTSAADSGGSDILSPGQPQFRYDSFRFLYRADYGRIVLVDQNPETGKAVSQIPSQRALQLYAEQKQAELRASITPASGSAGASTSGRDYQGLANLPAAKGTSATGASGATVAATSGSGAKAPAPTVSIPSPAYLTQAFPPVNITI
ncbi:MAG TPA: hypothetical protein VN229_01790 [Terriglobales bacterium]|nr:hypothetical protein [Terriglobales bacterium]